MGLLEKAEKVEHRQDRYFLGTIGTLELPGTKTFTRLYEYAGASTTIECEPQTVDICLFRDRGRMFALATFEGHVVDDVFVSRIGAAQKTVNPTESGTPDSYSIQWRDSFGLKDGERPDGLVVELEEGFEARQVGEYDDGRPMTRVFKAGEDKPLF